MYFTYSYCILINIHNCMHKDYFFYNYFFCVQGKRSKKRSNIYIVDNTHHTE